MKFKTSTRYFIYIGYVFLYCFFLFSNYQYDGNSKNGSESGKDNA